LKLDALLAELTDQCATMMAFNSTHVSRGGTFERSGESVGIDGSRVPLQRLVHPSWASDYLPLCPHLHDAERWIPTYTRALMLDDDPNRCPDERVKDYVRANRLSDQYIVLWTQDVVVEDIGRTWAAERGEAKNIGATPHCNITDLADGRPLALERSFAWQERAQRIIPGGTQTYMKRAECYAPGAFPALLDRGKGPYVWDVDGNAYIDFIAGLGACSLGHAPSILQAAVNGQLSKGVLTSLPTSIEVEAAETVVGMFDHCDQVRFFKTAADACSAAARLSRARTGRMAVASCGYHGWHDLFMQGTVGAPVDPNRRTFDPFVEEGEQALESIRSDGQVACAIIALPYEKTIPKESHHAIARVVEQAGAL